MKPGKEPIKNKKYEKLLETSSSEQNKLALTAEQQEYIDANGLEVRFIKKKDYLAANNFHRTGWKLISDSEMPGSNADGLVEVGDLVLAVKSKAAQAAHRAELKRKTERYTDPDRVNRQAADELKQSARASKLNAQIHVGYEENGSGGKDDD